MIGNPKLIFVYGTLKKGFPLHHYMEGAKFECATQTRHPDYDLIAIDGEPVSPYPAMISGKFHVAGELYDVPDKILKTLEKLEWRYTRTEVLLEGVMLPAYFFLYNQKNLNILPDCPLIIRDSSGKSKTWINP